MLETLKGTVLVNNGSSLLIQPNAPPATVALVNWKPTPIIANQADSPLLSGGTWAAITPGAQVTYQAFPNASVGVATAANVALA